MWFDHAGLSAAGQGLQLLGLALVAYEYWSPAARDRHGPGRPLTLTGALVLLTGLILELTATLLFPP